MNSGFLLLMIRLRMLMRMLVRMLIFLFYGMVVRVVLFVLQQHVVDVVRMQGVRQPVGGCVEMVVVVVIGACVGGAAVVVAQPVVQGLVDRRVATSSVLDGVRHVQVQAVTV